MHAPRGTYESHDDEQDGQRRFCYENSLDGFLFHEDKETNQQEQCHDDDDGMHRLNLR